MESVKAWRIGTFSSASTFGPAFATQCSASTVGSSSIVYASTRGLPCSRTSSSAISSISSSSASAARSMYRARSLVVSCAQAGWIRATSSTTPCTSAGVIVGTLPITSPVVGLRDSSMFTDNSALHGALHRLSVPRGGRTSGPPDP